ncbi:glycosyltransferase family 4 protein [Rudaeicoccus suwonensis]|uniref:Glycosyltransferase involved in cell wall biosynthesis n=1 Tax=Rudaeicoccus suwonensis TaxID=657409 RepID=A0A561DVM1_9MICO|nr:glycosyltransferase family 4 protein [Rudaeicoccus suwonensis]TWE07408.1 glycosyltransferase involved in cell wall biosynthesis [Rudaeicoccus suwonensis]
MNASNKLKSLRIAQIAPPWLRVPPDGYGGVERMVGNLSEGLVNRGHDVTLFAPTGSRTKGRLISPLEQTPVHKGPGAADADMIHMVTPYLMADEFDVIHDHTTSRIGPALGAMLGGRPPVVHTLHMPWTDVRRRFFSRVDNRIHLVASSPSQAALNPEISYTATIYAGIDLEMHPLGNQKEDYLAFVGRCCSEKGTDIALDISRAVDKPLVMILKHDDSSEREFFDEVVRPKMRNCDQVFEQPPHAEKIQLMQAASATLFPIRWDEPFGQVMAESLACGTPVIAMRRGAAKDLIVDGETGFLCDSVEGMIDAVGRVGDLAPQVCRQRVVDHFSAEAMIDGYENLYRSLLEQSA